MIVTEQYGRGRRKDKQGTDLPGRRDSRKIDHAEKEDARQRKRDSVRGKGRRNLRRGRKFQTKKAKTNGRSERTAEEMGGLSRLPRLKKEQQEEQYDERKKIKRERESERRVCKRGAKQERQGAQLCVPAALSMQKDTGNREE